jgi:hypothetical protein
MSPLWPLAHIQGRPGGATGTQEYPAHNDAVFEHVVVFEVLPDRSAFED